VRSCGVLLLLSLALATSAAGQEQDVRMAFLGDQGTADNAQRMVRQRLLARSPPFVFLLGDNLYSYGEASHIGPAFDEMYRPVMARGSAFHAALGNHDVRLCALTPVQPLPPDADAYVWRAGGCDVEVQLAHDGFGYRAHRRYYSVTTGPSAHPMAEVFVVDSNTLAVAGRKGTGRDEAQLQWLDQALALSGARWKIVIMHHPPESPSAWGASIGVGAGHEAERQLADQLQPILKRHDVDAVFAGHNHFYARMRPQGGIRYFVAGGGGRATYGFTWAPHYVASGGSFLHHVYVRLTHDRFEYYVIDQEGVSRDAGWFAKGDAEDTVFPAGTLPPAPPASPTPPPSPSAPALRPAPSSSAVPSRRTP
jgi:tartrate-resistant acid phosphatase type 5